MGPDPRRKPKPVIKPVEKPKKPKKREFPGPILTPARPPKRK
jgi:hypothetical protein